MTDLPPQDPRRDDRLSDSSAPTEPFVVDPYTVEAASPAPPPVYSTLPTTPLPAATAAPRRGLLGLGWAWWLAGGCGLLLLCCTCTLLLALIGLTANRGGLPGPQPPSPAATPRPASSEDPAPPATQDSAPPAESGRFGANPTGSVAPDFAIRTLDGQTVRLSDFRGRPVVVNFWATWCGPCEAEMPLLQKMHDTEKEAGVVLLAVDVQEMPSIVQRYVERKKLTFPILLDQSGDVAAQYRVRAYPTTFFIDAEGVVRSWQVGALTQTTLSRHLDRIR
jgi:peroxiredoxin